jgi:uncharacterized membrane protein (GlpM family)
MNYLYLLLKFVAGGIIVAGTTVLTEQIDPRYGGILATAPIITTLTLIIVYIETDFSITRDLALNSFFFIIPTALFLVVFAFFMNRFSFTSSIGGAFGIWLVSTLIVSQLLGMI